MNRRAFLLFLPLLTIPKPPKSYPVRIKPFTDKEFYGFFGFNSMPPIGIDQKGFTAKILGRS